MPSAIDRRPPVFSSFGEFAAAKLGLSHPPALVHVAWHDKTPFTVALPASAAQRKMVFRFVDPQPFLPAGAQRMMI